MDARARFVVPGCAGTVTLLDVIAVVSDLASDERELTAVVLHLVESGAIRWIRPPWELAN